MTLPGGATKTFTYDPLMRVKEITSADPGGNTVLNSQYSYDTMDNITAKDTEHGNYSYEYDALYRLTSSSLPGLAGQSSAEAFTYDNVGNRLTSAEAAGDWTYNDNNELLSLPGLSGQSSPASYEYDANGNMVKKTVGTEVTSYVYNIEDRLTQVWDGEVDTGTLVASYYYDPFGRRLWKDVGGTKTYYHYADEGLVAEMDAAGNVVKSYGWQPGSTWGTDPLFMKVGTAYYFYHNDHLGTPQKMTASNGAVVWSAIYSSFGKAEVAAESTVVNNLRFPGQYFDAESGLHYNWFRYYDPDVGRYLRVDPIYFEGGINFYTFVWNNPLYWIDPMGLRIVLVPKDPKSKQFEKQYEKAKNYLLAHDVDNVFAKLDESDTVFYIRETSNHMNQYDVGTDTIYWDPLSTVHICEQEAISPALVLYHESHHALGELEGTAKSDDWIEGWNYHTLEEYRVIHNYENPAARKLGEAVRNSHDEGRTFHTSDPTSTTIVNR